MNAPAPAHVPAPVSAQQRKWPRVLALLVVVAVLLALTAATFVLSYDGVRAVALEAGVSTSLARFYPGVLDAALVIACAAALLLRDGKWWARWYAWFAVIVIVAVAGGTDAVHAMNVALPHKQTEGVVAAAPWVLVLLAFSLWITILRQSRNAHRPAPEAGDAPVPEPAAASVPGAPAVIAPAPQSPPEVEPEPNVVDLVPFSEPAPETPESAAEPESAPEETAPEPTIPVPMLSAPVDLAPIDTTPDSLDETAPDEVVPDEVVVPEEAASEETLPEETAPVMEAEPAGQAETDAAEPPAEEAEAAPEIDSTAEPELRAEPAPPAATPEDERGETSEEEASEEEEPQDEQPQEPAVASKAPTAAKSSPRPLDYWDIDEDEKTDHETPADSGSPAEVHHTLDDPAPQTSASVPVTRFRRVRSTPVRPEEEETDENP